MIGTELSSFGDFRFGDWVVQPRLNRLTRHGSTVPLEPKVMRVLVCLAQHARDLVTRQDLIDTVWSVEFIADNTLTRAIADLRNALGDDARDPSLIETIHRRGYRLLVKPGPVSDEESSIVRTLSHYILLEHLGGGGMGVVYRAEDTKLGREVAMKFLPKDLSRDPEARDRFMREARAASALDHPHICTIHEIDETPDGQLFIVMTYYEGETLKKKIERAPLAAAHAVRIVCQIADGLDTAHRQGIVHRDIKPANVMVTTDGVAKILDFGLAKMIQTSRVGGAGPRENIHETSPGTLIGTTAYMAPEQVRGGQADQRCDIFSLGVVLYEMLSGTHPFSANTPAETAAAILTEEPPRPAELRSEAPPELAAIVARALEKDVGRRYQSAAELLADLGGLQDRLQDREGITETAPPRIRPRRRPSIAPVIVAGAVFLVTVAVILYLRPGVVTDPLAPASPRIVVLPFENLGPPDDEYFADGITGEITSRLAAVRGLQVISRTSAMYYKGRQVPLRQIGEELDVGYALEGTVRWERAGEGHGRVRITPQLIQVADDTQLWSERYDEVLEDIFDVQSDIAEHVIARLRAALLKPERRAIEARPTADMEAYQAYLRGVQYLRGSFEERPMRLAVEMFERAVALDPGFALAHARLSEAHSTLYNAHLDVTPERLQMAKASAERALELRPGLPEGHRALGWYYYNGLRNYERALEHFATAAQNLGNDPGLLMGLAAIDKRRGRFDEALEVIGRWQRVDPQNATAPREAAIIHRVRREFAHAEAEIMRAIAIEPDRADLYGIGALIYLGWDGSTDRARRFLASAPALDSPWWQLLLSFDLEWYDRKPELVMARLPELPTDFVYLGVSTRTLWECVCLSEMGERDRARAACSSAVADLELHLSESPEDHYALRNLGLALALLGKEDEAVWCGERAVELMPRSKDALAGAAVMKGLAEICALVGRYEQALGLIDELLSIPSGLSVGMLRLDPVWDPLRDQPRFQALLEKYDTSE